MSTWIFLGSAGEGNDDFHLLEAVPMVEGIVGTGDSCALRLRDPMLTPQHARVLTRDGAWYVGGIAVAAQTRINGVATIPGQAVRLAVGDVVEMGSARFRFGAEPPQRQGIDANDEAATLTYGDRLAEQGSLTGERILEGQPPESGWLRGAESAIDEGRALPEWKRGLLTALTVREFSLPLLEGILADEGAVALERLVIAISTCGGHDEEESTRAVLQVIAATRPPRLRKIDLGWIHQPLDQPGVASDWQSVAKRVPIQGELHEAYQVAGSARFTVLRSGPHWPDVGTTNVLPSVGHASFGNRGEEVRQRRGITFSRSAGTCVHFSDFSSKKDEECFTVNGHWGSAHRKLTHGDLVEGQDFAFRFEESP